MAPEEISFALAHAAEEGWNPGIHDAVPFYSTDPKGFFIGLLDDKPIGCISAVSYGRSFGFIGFYIIIPEYRGKGFGIQLWNTAMNYLGNHNIGLDGVLAQQDNYRKSGFKFAYSNIRFEYISGIGNMEQNKNIVPVKMVDFDVVLEYDSRFFPAMRENFLKHWLNMPMSKTACYIDKGILTGFGVIRHCQSGYKIGPLFAENSLIAEQLFLNLISYTEPGTAVYLDIPEVNPAGILLAKKYNIKQVFGTARMYTGKFPPIDLNKVFGVTTFELG